MWDLPDADVGRVVAAFLASDRPVAAVCHGPAALVGSKDADGEPIVKGRRVAASTHAEEEAAGLTGTVPFLLGTCPRGRPGEVSRAPVPTPVSERLAHSPEAAAWATFDSSVAISGSTIGTKSGGSAR